jgi:hypothetical protein
MLSVANKPLKLIVITLNVIMLSDASKPFRLSVIPPNVIMLSVLAPFWTVNLVYIHFETAYRRRSVSANFCHQLAACVGFDFFLISELKIVCIIATTRPLYVGCRGGFVEHLSQT